jgi:hypothetical protein
MRLLVYLLITESLLGGMIQAQPHQPFDVAAFDRDRIW